MIPENINEKEELPFIDKVTPDMDGNAFWKIAREYITEEDQVVFGNNYQEQMLTIMLSFSVFAPFPATFDSKAIAFVIDLEDYTGLKPRKAKKTSKRTKYVINRAQELGIIEPGDNERFSIKQETIDKLRPILKRFEK